MLSDYHAKKVEELLALAVSYREHADGALAFNEPRAQVYATLAQSAATEALVHQTAKLTKVTDR